MGKTKKVKKPTKEQKLKALVDNGKFHLQIAEQRLEKLNLELNQRDKVIADKGAAVARLMENLQEANRQTAEARAERDRIMRVVDQFTSVQILSPQLTTKELRKT